MFRNKRIKYYYDTDSCQYEKAEFDIKNFAKTVSMYLGVSVVFCAISFVIFQDSLFSLKEKQLSAKRIELENGLQEQNTEISEMEEILQEMYTHDRVYSTMLNTGKIPATVWESGRGGSPKYSKFDPDISSSTLTRLEKLQDRAKRLKASFESKEDINEELRTEMGKVPAILPIKGALISFFGNRRHPIKGYTHFHTGLDFACPIGTEIYATGDAIVSFAGRKNNGYGIHIDLNHQNGFETKYAHMNQVLVNEGQTVKRGDLIGYSGNTGMSTGPHLHYEIKKNDVKINPIDNIYLNLPPDVYLMLADEAQGADDMHGNVDLNAPMD